MAISDIQTVEITGREGLDEKIGLGHQPPKQGTAVRGFQVQGDAALVGGIGPPVEALLRMRIVVVEGADVAGRAAAGRLDLDYVGAQVRKYLAAEQAPVIGEVQDTIGAEEQACFLILVGHSGNSGNDMARLGPPRVNGILVYEGEPSSRGRGRGVGRRC